MYKKIMSLALLLLFAVLFYSAIAIDNYNNEHSKTVECKIIYQNDPSVNWQKFSDIAFEYKGDRYTTKEFHSRIDLTKHYATFIIRTNDNGKVYEVLFDKYTK